MSKYSIWKPSLAIGAIVLAGFFAGSGVSSSVAPSGPDVAHAADTSYRIEVVDLQYPFVPEGTATTPDESQAGVKYDARWGANSYPGPAPCFIVLKDAGGNIVGRKEFTLDSLATTFLSNFEPVTVSAPPASGEATCGSGHYPTDANYSFEFTGAGSGESSRSRLTFVSRWTSDVAPATRSCTLEVELRSGRTLRLGPFHMYLGKNGEEISLSVPAEPEAIADAAISCASL